MSARSRKSAAGAGESAGHQPDPGMDPIAFATAQLEIVLRTAKAAEDAESFVAAVQARRTANELYRELEALRKAKAQAESPQTVEAKLGALVGAIGKLPRAWLVRVEEAARARRAELDGGTGA